jgi:hypothetical protein
VEEISCPLCGKPNPVDNKFCDYCLANLHPLADRPIEPDPQMPPPIGEDQQGLGGYESESEVPDWLRELQQTSHTGGEEEIEATSALDQLSGAESEWSDDETTANKSKMGEGESVTPFLPDQEISESQEIPHWLNEALNEGEPQDTNEDEIIPEISFIGDEAESSQVESGSGQSGKDNLSSSEGAGPLAGLKGILSVEASVARSRKPKAYSTKLNISPSQQAHIELLKGLLEQEGQPQPVSGRKLISQQYLMRWGIALVLLLSILWPIVTTSQQMPFPAYDEGSAEVNRLINQLPENAHVLVGFDYEPALADELDTAAAPVIDHLMNEGALLTLISTSPFGPILAERFIQSTQSNHGYVSGTDYINLGYIPGGTAGLLSFIENPQGTMPYAIDGLPAWETGTGSPLAEINQITDFEMVILLVDDPDIARSWIEQLGSKIIDPQVLTSFALITSAQLEPVVRPYYESIPQPVNGLVVGLRGGAAYTRIVGNDNLPSLYWDAFGLGIFVAAMLILIGSLGYYVVPELTRTARGQEKVS